MNLKTYTVILTSFLQLEYFLESTRFSGVFTVKTILRASLDTFYHQALIYFVANLP
jgi:hypothetical protein